MKPFMSINSEMNLKCCLTSYLMCHRIKIDLKVSVRLKRFQFTAAPPRHYNENYIARMTP